MKKKFIVLITLISTSYISAIVQSRTDRNVVLKKQANLRQTSRELNELVASEGSKATKAAQYSAMKEKLIRLEEDGFNMNDAHNKLDTWYNELPSV